MRLGKSLYSLVIFLGVSVLGGALIAGLAIPAASMVTTVGRDAAKSLEALPAEFEVTPSMERTRVELADGSFLTYLYEENRVEVPLDKVAPIMQQAQVAIEDHRFFQHGAIDVTGTARALLSTAQGVVQGGSSITQQYVRLLQLQAADAANDRAARDAATEATLSRKIREMRYAMALEKQLTKEQILEGYLNISYFGDGAYGVETAAKHYFGVSAKDLNLAQAAMLAGLVRNPVNNNPVKHERLAIERRNDVIDRMLALSLDPQAPQYGLITKEEAEAAKAEPFDQSKVVANPLDCANSRYPFVCDYAKRVLKDNDSGLGATPEEREDYLYRGGLTIRLTIDPKIMKKAEKTLLSYLDPRDPAVGVITMLQPQTGDILAMAQSRPVWGNKPGKGTTNFNYAVTQKMGGREGFQGGSTFKIFTAAAALANGYGAYGKYKADNKVTLEKFRSCNGQFTLNDPWSVTGGYGGAMIDMFTGATKSVNTYFAQLIQAVGVCETVTMATKLGLEMGKPQPQEKRLNIMDYNDSPAFTLGAVEVSPLSLVSAYGVFGNRGVRCEPNIIVSIKTRTGVEIEPPNHDCKRVIPKDVADGINKVFQGPMNNGTASPAKVRGVQMAGKTGTVSKTKAVWTIGYTPELVAGAVISYDSDPYHVSRYWGSRLRKNQEVLRNSYMKYSKTWIQASSGRDAGGRLLHPVFEYAVNNIKGFKGTKFKEPPREILLGEQVTVPSCQSLSVKECTKKIEKAGFVAFTKKVESDAAKDTLVGTSPSGKAPKGSGIAIEISKGPKEGSQAWCDLDGNQYLDQCQKYLPPPTCAEGEVLVPDPPPGTCVPAHTGGRGGRDRDNG